MEQKKALGRMMVEGFQKGDPAIVEGCLKRDADPNVQVAESEDGPERPVLHWAMRHFNEAAARLLLDYGADIEARNKDGETPLIFAIKESNPAAVTFLMKHGADPVAQDARGKVALDTARALRADYDSYAAKRSKIIHALTADYAPVASAESEAAREIVQETPPEASSAEVLQKDIKLLKPVDLKPHRKPGEGGLNL